ncbi:diguanylate cyclase [Pseudomonas sp. UL073]|uniref:diguanylate cyclase n=1 Tax=Zestomonas insulae TaxID=2809017 RepID=A0ABS2IGQ5_9GAMM|nr:diguanylate cyclase [Pseudomonas insulae]MBM7061100.1 diguanylate cyclase [Pseudomonas insulae]
MNVCVQSGWLFSLPLALIGAVSAGVLLVALWVARQPYFSGRSTFVVLHAAMLWWLLAVGVELGVQGASCKVFWASMAWPGIAAVPSLWAVFLWQYVNSIRTPLRPAAYLLLGVGPLVACVLAIVNPGQLFYGPLTAPLNDLPGAPVIYQHGPLFNAVAIYVYLFMLFSLAVVLRGALASQGLHRRHYLAFVLVTCVPWLANAGHLLYGWSLFGFDPTPFSFAFTLVAFTLLITAVRLFDLVPVARHLLLEELPDPVLVVDAQGRVVEANRAALQLSGAGDDWQGRALRDWPLLGGELQRLLAQGAAGDDREPLLTLAAPLRHFELRARNIERQTRSGPLSLGCMLYLRDVTQRHLSELQLGEALALSEERLRTISSLHGQLQELALRDPLTGLYNRRHLDEYFVREQARCLREDKPIALALVDLDHFKLLNDEHGHLTGDDVLRELSRRLTDSLRGSDAVFRIGGEEFLLVLPGAEAEEAYRRLAQICQQLAQVPMATRVGNLVVTLSAGLSHWPAQGAALDGLLQVADAALYEAKHRGRNQVCMLQPTER